MCLTQHNDSTHVCCVCIVPLSAGITRQLFLDDQSHFVGEFLAYSEQEFGQSWPLPKDVRQQLQAKHGGAAAAACGMHVSITAESTAELQACQ
jgi:hypothetical protein